jgi:DNA-directed RNA polymerase specialized sigma24 family protein
VTEPPNASGEGAARLPPYLRHAFGEFTPAPSPPPPPSEETLRPFVLTSGRVSADDQDISLETQVTSNYDAGTAQYATIGLPSELRAIITLCDVPMSVAEISARLRLHLGVTRILVGDLRAAGHLEIHHQDVTENHSPDVILRVIRGLRAIT